MADSTFRGVLEFFGELGVYDIILPFLLVFTIIFAILEKTKILGIDKIDGNEVAKKNLNSMVAFVTAFLVIASTQLVSIINEVVANVVLLLILAVSFLMLVGTFFGDKEFTLKDFPTWVSFFMIFMFIGVIVIFLNALGWLEEILDIFRNFDQEWAASIILMAIIIGFMFFITWEPKKQEKKKE